MRRRVDTEQRAESGTWPAAPANLTARRRARDAQHDMQHDPPRAESGTWPAAPGSDYR